jgi:hypothetical protein
MIKHDTRTHAGREALSHEILDALQNTTLREPLSAREIGTKLGGIYDPGQLRQRLKALVSEGKVLRRGEATLTRYSINTRRKR